MSRIFISHSSANNALTLAIGRWLADNGWDDYFLDLEPAKGMAHGERWKEALRAAADHCEAVLTVLEKGKAGEVYNVGGNNERSNLELTHSILSTMGKGQEMIRPVKDRPGHDLRYAIDASKIKRELGWEPKRSAWPRALESTVRWYVDNQAWWKRVKSGEYRGYYARQYGGR